MTSSLVHLPYIDFLTAYPHPAFIVQGKRRLGQAAPDINPVLGNPAFRSLLLGPDADTAELGHAFLRSLQTVENADRFAQWLYVARTDHSLRIQTLVVKLRPSWIPLDSEPVVLEFSQTVLEDYTVCTSTPRSPLPKYTALPVQALPSASASMIPGRADRGMRIPDFPPPPTQLHPNPATMSADAFSALMRTPTGSGKSSYSPERHLEFSGPAHAQKGGMLEMIETYDWHLTPLGPRDKWSPVLKTAVKYMLAHPFPVSLWVNY